MDFKGQEYSEKLALKLLILSAATSFLLGYFKQDFGLMMAMFAAGFVLTFIVTVPNWPIYNKHPIEWVKSKSKGGKKKRVETGLIASMKRLFH